MALTPRKPGTSGLKPSTSLGTKSTGAKAAPIAARPTAKSAITKSATLSRAAPLPRGVVDTAASKAKSAAIYGSKPAASTPKAAPRAGTMFGNVGSGVRSTAPAASTAKKGVFGNVIGGVASTAATAPRALPSTYTVLRGDSLSKIAKRLYGKASAWRGLFEANRDQIDDADLIHPGQVLRVPQL